MRTLLLSCALLLPTAAFAAGGGSFNPPSTTKTTTDCKAGEVYDEKSKTCVDSSQSSVTDDLRYDAVRELAYAGAFGRAELVLNNFDEPRDDRALTYRGFIARKSGDVGSAMDWYTAALAENPDNLLARSYMGQGFVESGDMASARGQLTEIRARGGRGTWAEFSLAQALQSGSGYAY